MRDFAPITSQVSSIEPTVAITPSFSAEPGMVSVPDMKDLTPQQARLVLEGLGLVVKTEKRIDSAYPVDYVISSEPVSGTSVSAGTSITITVASGRNIVPQVAGMSAQEAQEKLSAAGFMCTLLGADGVPVLDLLTRSQARVVQIRPSGGSLLKVGSTVISVVDVSGAIAPAPIATASPLPTTAATPGVGATPQP
jgi:serine/threonine-protein kinase